MNVANLATCVILLILSGFPSHGEEAEVPQPLQFLLESDAKEKERVLKPIERKLETALVD